MENKPLQPTEHRYVLKCEIIKKRISYVDVQSDGIKKPMEGDFIYLIPQESTQRDLFLDAWIPDTREEVSEIGCRAGAPVFGYFRCYVRRSNNIIDRPHIGVMSLGAEQDLISFYDEKKRFWPFSKKVCIEVEVLGEQEDQLLDQAKDGLLPFQKKRYENKEIIKVE